MSCIRGSYTAASNGDTLFPVTVKIQNANGGYSDVTALSDTGNEKSIMKRSVADLLGLNLANGDEFRVKGINGNSIQFRKFRLMVKIGSFDAIPVEIGFAVNEGDLAENLLGNEDIVKSGKFEVSYDDRGVTYKLKGGGGGRIACGGAEESQQTVNNLYDQLQSARSNSVRRKKPSIGHIVSNGGGYY